MVLVFIFWFEFLHNNTMFELFKQLLIAVFITALGLATLVYISVKKKKKKE
ncbi:MAG TPA: hypothetical protein VMZ29_10895 [Candidatus Bathyarchaeia archaeon]|nr:hypothetical protein [Candidatus Bathyarchaeia archaeon]